MSRDAGMKSRACRPVTPDRTPWMARGGAWNRMFPRAGEDDRMAGAVAGNIR